jgi:Tol biopolymer transport system component
MQQPRKANVYKSKADADWRELTRPGTALRVERAMGGFVKSRATMTEGTGPGANDRLDSWKEIAAYLGKGVRTVQRWEQTEGLPVRRLGEDRAGSVFAYRSEVDAWWQQKSRRLSPEEERHASGGTAPRSWVLVAAVVLIVAAAGGVAWRFWPARVAAHHPVPVTTDHGWELYPSFSPDARYLAYVWVRKQSEPGYIYVRPVAGGSVSRLTGGTGSERGPAWSPDGRLIAFFRKAKSQANASLLVIAPSGGPETRIAEFRAGGEIVWSADGRWLITAEMVGKTNVLVAVSVSTGKRHRLTGPHDFNHCGYGLTPDSSRLIYCRGNPGPATIFELPLGPGLKPAGAPRALFRQVGLREIVLQRHGSEIIYTEGIWEEGVGLWRRRLEPGAQPELIHASSQRYATPALSADGRRLAFTANRTYREDIWRLRLNDVAAGAVPLLSSTHSDMNPDYSPDGRYIAFHSTRTGASEIWIANRDGSDARRLTHTNARTTATPRWSRDGSRIAFESNQTGQSEVYVIPSSGGPAQPLTHHPATDAIPSWSADGRTIYFCSDRTGRYEIWKMPAAGGEPVQVTRSGGFTAVESPDGQFLYYTETRSFGPLWRVRLSGGTPEQISPEVRGLFFAVTRRGVYFPNRAIFFWDAERRQVREVFAPPRPTAFGLAVSPDEKELLFTQFESDGADIYLIDGLR